MPSQKKPVRAQHTIQSIRKAVVGGLLVLSAFHCYRKMLDCRRKILSIIFFFLFIFSKTSGHVLVVEKVDREVKTHFGYTFPSYTEVSRTLSYPLMCCSHDMVGERGLALGIHCCKIQTTHRNLLNTLTICFQSISPTFLKSSCYTVRKIEFLM